jgi:hypothetical protein
MDSSTNFWENLIMYNENVLKWCGSVIDVDSIYDETYDLLIDEDDDIIIFDDSDEWYNTHD